MTLFYPPETNTEKVREEAGGWDGHSILYRGLGLPEEAIKVYEKYMDEYARDPKRKEDELYDDYRKRTWIFFTGFTATSLDKKIALRFAHQATQRKGQVPVLFVMDL